MQGTIFQINTRPYDPSEFLTPADYSEDPFVGRVADYVTQDMCRDDSIRQLLSVFQKTGVDLKILHEAGVTSFVFPSAFKELYFQNAYALFRVRATILLAKLSLAEFASLDMPVKVARLAEIVSAPEQFYVRQYDETITLDQFIREARIGVQYYIGGTLNYHM